MPHLFSHSTIIELHVVLMVLKKSHLTRDHGGWIDNGCVRLSQKLLLTQIESGDLSGYPSSLTGPLVQLNISSCFSPMIHFYIFCRFLLRSASVNHPTEPLRLCGLKDEIRLFLKKCWNLQVQLKLQFSVYIFP